MNQLNQQVLFAIGVNHNTASIEVREKVYVHESETLALLKKLSETLSECVVISTCNRTEIYGLHPRADKIDFDFYKNLLIAFKNASGAVCKEDFFSFLSCTSCEQLFKVATSINSKIIGDMQILQQVRQSYFIAKQNGYTGKVLNQLFQRAFKIGKKTRLETSIHKGAISISLAAVELARENFDTLADKTVLIVGAGETAQLTAECLLKKRVGKILVANRTKEHAEAFLNKLHVSHEFNGEVIDFENFRDYLNETDIVISSTSSPDYVLHAEDFADQFKKILLIDIAVPRDIEPESAKKPNVILRNIDDLNTVVGKNYEKRMSELARVEKIVYREMGEFLMWYYALPLMPAAQDSGEKLTSEKILEIKKVRQILEANAEWFHQIMRQNRDVESELAEHLKLVERLNAAKETAFEGVFSFEK